MIEFKLGAIEFKCSILVPFIVSVIFAALKLLGIISWAWMIVFLPLMIWFGLFVVIAIFVLLVGLIRR